MYLGPCQTPLMDLFDRVPNAFLSKSERDLKISKYEEVVLTTFYAPAQMFGEGENFGTYYCFINLLTVATLHCVIVGAVEGGGLKFCFPKKQHWVHFIMMVFWDNVFKNEPSKICGRQPLTNLKGMVYFIPLKIF